MRSEVEAMKKKNVLIVAPGHTGTSMVAALFRTGDYYFGKGPEPMRKEDKRRWPEGVNESTKIVQLNEKLLKPVVAPLVKGKKNGQRWLSVVEDLDGIVADAGDIEKMSKLIKRAKGQPFCYKDPRFCYTLGAWDAQLPKSTVFICVVRDPGETATSMVRDSKKWFRKKIRFRHALRVWECMYRHILDKHHRQDEDRWLFVHFEQVLEHDQSTIERLNQHTGTTVDSSRAHRNALRCRGKTISSSVQEEDADFCGRASNRYIDLCKLADYNLHTKVISKPKDQS